MSAPRWACRLLAALALPGRKDDVVGDLEEAHRRRRARRGPAVAAILTGLDTLDMAIALLRARVRDSSLSLLDLKLGFRMLVKYPGLTLVGGVAMAFAIAVGVGSFEFLKDAAYPRFPVEGGERLVRIHNVHRLDPADRLSVSLEDFLRWKAELRTVEGLGALHGVQRNLDPGGGGGAPVTGVATSASAFAVAPVAPLLGRPLVAADEAPGAPSVAVISHDLWLSRFGGDVGVMGREIRLGDTPTTVVGVMPAEFVFPAPVDLWVPLRVRDAPGADGGPATDRTVSVFGRLAPGVELDEARAEVEALGLRPVPESGEGAEGAPARARPSLEPYASPAVTMGEMAVDGIMVLSCLFLLGLVMIPCVNVALLVFARAAGREGEIVVRTALGASRGRIVRQLFAEALVLAAVATAAGLAAAAWGLRWVIGVMNAQDEGLPPWFGDSLSPSAVAWAFGLGVVGAAVVGVLPALRVTGADVQAGLQRAAGRGSGVRMGGVWTGIIVTQIALTVLFVPVVLLLGRDTWAIRNADLGVPAEEYLAVQLEMDGDLGGSTGGAVLGWGATLSGEELVERFDAAAAELVRRVEAEPGVLGATAASRLPGESHGRRWIEIDGPAEPPGESWAHRPQVARVAADFFDELDIPLVAGRAFGDARSTADEGAVVVNESFVSEFLGGRNAVGRHIRFPDEATNRDDPATAPWHEIVGVVRDVALGVAPDLPHRAGVYQPLVPGSAYPLRVAVHLAGPPEAFTGRLRELAAAVDPTLRLHRPMSMSDTPRDLLSAYDTWFRVVVVAGGLALLLTNAGIYAIVSFTVSRRTREIGVRVALGADRARIAREILVRALKQIGLGVLVGGVLLVALLLAFGVGRPTLSVGRAALLATYLAVMTGVCMTACLVPTRRALAIEPTEALRGDG